MVIGEFGWSHEGVSAPHSRATAAISASSVETITRSKQPLSIAAPIEWAMIGLSANGRMFALRGMRLLPPRAGMIATFIREHLGERSDDLVLLGRREGGGTSATRWRRHEVALGLGEIARAEAEALVVGLRMHRDVMDVHADTGGTQGLENLPPTRGIVQADRVEVQRGAAVGCCQGVLSSRPARASS